MPKLKNAKHELFAQEYEVDRNATQAAIRAGYSEKAARVSGARLLTDANVLARVNELTQERCERLCLSADFVVQRLLDVYARCMQAEPVLAWNSLSKSMEPTGDYAFDSRGANRALEMLGKHLGMFNDRIQLTVERAPRIVDDIGEPNDDSLD